MLKNIHRAAPADTCHEVGACLLQADCPCAGPCVRATPSVPLRLAPGVLDGPYVRRQRAPERLARALLLLAVVLALGVPVVQLARLVGWL